MSKFYNPDSFRWRSSYIAFTNHAKNELWIYELDVIQVIDMLNSSFECKDTKKGVKTDIEVCSIRKRQIFRILLFHDFCREVQEDCLVVKHVKPA